MTDNAALTKAIAAHSAWRRRLSDAITSGAEALTPDQVRADNRCEFGMWLYGVDAASRTDPHYAGIKDLHAQFHQAAADVLAMALAGKKTEAIPAMTFGSPFASLSSKLTASMTTWSRDITG